MLKLLRSSVWLLALATAASAAEFSAKDRQPTPDELAKLPAVVPEKAEKLMMQVHTEGKAVVSSGMRAAAEGDVARLHAHGLWATLQKDS